MAIEKTLSFDNEFGAAFTDITDVFIYIRSGLISRNGSGDLVIEVKVQEFVDKAAKDAGAKPVATRTFSQTLPAGWQTTLETALINNVPRYSGATSTPD